MLDGDGDAPDPDGERELARGAVVAFPTGPGGAARRSLQRHGGGARADAVDRCPTPRSASIRTARRSGPPPDSCARTALAPACSTAKRRTCSTSTESAASDPLGDVRLLRHADRLERRDRRHSRAALRRRAHARSARALPPTRAGGPGRDLSQLRRGAHADPRAARVGDGPGDPGRGIGRPRPLPAGLAALSRGAGRRSGSFAGAVGISPSSPTSIAR